MRFLANYYRQLYEKLVLSELQVMVTSLSKENSGDIKDLHREIISRKNNSTYENEKDKIIKAVLMEGRPRVVEEENNRIFIEPFYPKERLIILGGGHIALPLVDIGAIAGFAITVVDDRPSFANKKRFPKAESVICESFERCFDTLKITQNDYIVIITRGHRHDTDCLRQILKREESIYVGMIGSKRRVHSVKEQLIEEGYDRERINHICSPIGLSIGAITPEEISISIMAEIIKRKRLDEKAQIPINRSDLEEGMTSILANKISEPCSLVTIITSRGSVPRGPGAKMIVYPTGKMIGSIGGGCSEAAVMRAALEIIGTKKYIVEQIDMTGDTAEEEGMVCGGVMEVLIEDLVLE